MPPCDLASSSPSVFTAPSPTEIYTLSLHDALPIFLVVPEGCRDVDLPALCAPREAWRRALEPHPRTPRRPAGRQRSGVDRKSTRLNSSHTVTSYAVFCLKKKTKVSRWQATVKQLSL